MKEINSREWIYCIGAIQERLKSESVSNLTFTINCFDLASHLASLSLSYIM